jgi:uncharacterized protein (TIGR03067 family)
MVAPDLVQVPLTVRTSTFTLTSATPRQMDLTTVQHFDQSELHTKAIYKVESDRLTYCVGAPGQSRPTEFATKSGDGNTLVVLRRISP